MADLNLKSETIDKAIDTFGKPLYDDVAKPAIQTSKSALGFCSQFIVSGIKPFMYSKIKECEYKIKEIDKRLEKKYNHILDENKTEPRTNILGPAVDVLKYNLEEEHIKEMFINLIGNDMDKSKQSKVLPSYIEIVKQLSSADAEMLKTLASNSSSNEPIMSLKFRAKTGGFVPISNDILLIRSESVLTLKSLCIDNLKRLNLIDVNFNSYRAEEQIYTSAFEKYTATNIYILPNYAKKLDYSKGLLQITDYGKNFINICLS